MSEVPLYRPLSPNPEFKTLHPTPQAVAEPDQVGVPRAFEAAGRRSVLEMAWRPALESSVMLTLNSKRFLGFPDIFFFFTLFTGRRRSLGLKLSDTRVYEPQIRARILTSVCRP